MASIRSSLLVLGALALSPAAASAQQNSSNSATQSLQNFDSVFQSIEQNNPSNGQSTGTTGGTGTTLPALTLIAPAPTLSPTDYQTLLGGAQTAAATYFSQAQSMASSYVALLGTQTLASMFESLTLGLLDAPYATLPSGGGTSSTTSSLPCDVAATAGTACSAAHSVTRLLTANYTGPLFQVQRVSDSKTQDIYPYSASTLPSGATASLVGSANLASITTFCGAAASTVPTAGDDTATGCTVSNVYDQIDLIGAIKGGFGSISGMVNVDSNGAMTSLTVPASGGAGSQTASIVTGADGWSKVATLTTPSGDKLTVQLTYAQTPDEFTKHTTSFTIPIGNDLPPAIGWQSGVAASGPPTVPYPSTLYLTTRGNAQIPALNILKREGYRQRTGTVNQALGDTEIAEYMVAGSQFDAQYKVSVSCCGTYGNEEASADNNVFGGGAEGKMFVLAWYEGSDPFYSYSAGYTPGGSQSPVLGVNWPGIDVEAGVLVYGPQQPPSVKFVSVLSKYSPKSQSNLLAVKGGDASQSVLTTDYEQAPPPATYFGAPVGRAFDGAWQGGLSIGESGDGGTPPGTPDGNERGVGGGPVQFFEGAIIAKATSDATDNAIQTSIGGFYGPAADTTAAACYANNLINLPLSLATSSAWTAANGATAASATDISGTTTNAATLVNSTGSQYALVNEWIQLQAGQTYTFTDYVLATTNATVFPGGSIQTDDSGQTEFAWVIDTNKGQAVAGTWSTGTATSVSAVQSGAWWKVTMTFTAPGGSNNAHIFLDAPIANASGVRSQQAVGLAATHYCPSLAIASTLPTATATQ
jgi:non-reducing end alpha-L-arabinofuranosidase